MATWKRIIIIYLSTVVVCAFTYVTAVVVFEGGIELGEPMWKGYLLQLYFLSTLGLIYFGIFLIPIMLLVEKYVSNSIKKLSIYGVTTLTLLTFAYIQYSGTNLWTSIPLSTFGTIIILFIQYLTIRSSSCFARDRANRAAP